MQASQARIASHIQARTSRAREGDQAAPRPARVRFSVRTQGVGESRLVGAHAIDFGALMLDEPTFSFGVVTLDNLKVGELPLATATVLRWKQTGGLWAGAEVGFRVESMRYTIRLVFNLIFEGSTMRSTVGTGTETLAAPRGTNVYRGQTSVNTGAL